MPQLDKYIFLNQILALFFFFFLVYFYIRGTVIPKLNAILKYRNKKIAKLIRHEKSNIKIYNNTNLFFSKWGSSYLTFTNKIIVDILKNYNRYALKETDLINSEYLKSVTFTNKLFLNNKNNLNYYPFNKNIIFNINFKNNLENKRLINLLNI